MESKIKHLEFIQAIISRMSSNSFIVKGWCVALVAAIFALSSRDSNQNHFILALIPVSVCWLLDGYYLSRERLFRELYDNVREKKNSQIDFSMKTSKSSKRSNSWFFSIFSATPTIFYIGIIGVIIITYSLIK